jgi:TfoX/Sxy family transcriptional regulator of competence genes
MAYDDHFADRIRKIFKDNKTPFKEKKMMGGLCFMVNDKMCAGIVKEKLMARINPDFYQEALTQKGCHEMDFTGKPMKGYVFVTSEGTDLDTDLEYWIQLCLKYNPLAKSSKK